MPSTDKRANAILKHEEELLSRLDSYDALKHEFLSLNRKYEELLDGVSLYAVLFGILERSENFESFKSAVADKRGELSLKIMATREALAFQGRAKSAQPGSPPDAAR